MQEDMSRRSFLKGAMISAASVAATGVLASSALASGSASASGSAPASASGSASGSASAASASGSAAGSAAASASKSGSAAASASASASAAASAASASASAAASSYDVDIAVVGGGITGFLAAIAAEEAGATSLILEKRSKTGGSAAKSSAFMVTNDEDNSLGFPADQADSVKIDAIMDRLMGMHEQADDKDWPNEQFLRDIFSQTEDTITFMLGLGLTATFDRDTRWDGAGGGLMANLADIANQKGITVLLDTPARELIVDESGAVCGVSAVDYAGNEVTVNAKKVVIASGGATYNQERMQKYMPTLSNMTLIGLAEHGDTGDGMTMAEAIGAAPAEPMRVMGAGAEFDPALRATLPQDVHLSAADHLVVGSDGKRFANENPTMGTMFTYWMVKNGLQDFVIYDSTNTDIIDTLELGVTMGEVFKAANVDELAGYVGCDTATMQDTLDTYNAAAAAGKDDEFGKDADHLIAYAMDGTFYAVKCYPGAWGTIGGVTIDETGHVLDADGNQIPNLFAGGAAANRQFFSDFYIGGNSMATSSTMGRICGQTAVAEL